jgi:hypothetical protein
VPPAPVRPCTKPRRQPLDLEQQFKQQLEFERLQLELQQLLQLKQQFEFIEQFAQLQLQLIETAAVPFQDKTIFRLSLTGGHLIRHCAFSAHDQSSALGAPLLPPRLRMCAGAAVRA